MMNYPMLFGLVLGALGIVRIAEWLLKNAIPKQQKSLLLREEYEMLKTLHELHDKRNGDGVPVWYVRRSLEQAVKDLSESIASLGSTLNLMSANCGKHTEVLEKIHDEVKK